MYKLCYFDKNYNKWKLHSVGSWDECLELGHQLFGQTIEWVLNQLGTELFKDYTFDTYIVTWERGLLKTSFDTLEKS